MDKVGKPRLHKDSVGESGDTDDFDFDKIPSIPSKVKRIKTTDDYNFGQNSTLSNTLQSKLV